MLYSVEIYLKYGELCMTYCLEAQKLIYNKQFKYNIYSLFTYEPVSSFYSGFRFILVTLYNLCLRECLCFISHSCFWSF
jgi:hypothetical protein